MQKIKIKSIKKLNKKRNVYDLTVQENHNFFIGKTKILTHNCDYLSANAQAALRNLMETHSQNTRFVLTCNYPDKMIPALISRCQVFEMIPPSKVDVAVYLDSIFKSENVKYNEEDVKFLIMSKYPDIRSIVNTAQNYTINNQFKMDRKALIESDFKLKILDILQDEKMSSKNTFDSIRQILADNQVSDFTDVFKLLYDNIDLYASGHLAPVIMILSEMSYKSTFVVDKEINFMSTIVQILSEIK